MFSLKCNIFQSPFYKGVFTKHNTLEVKSHSAKNTVLGTEYNNIVSCFPL